MRFILFTISLFTFSNFFSQEFKISGKVLNENSQGLANAVVTAKPSSKFSKTDLNGNFSLSLPEGNYTFVVKCVGYDSKSLEINVLSDQNLDFNLTAKVLQLDTLEFEANEVEEHIQSVEMSKMELDVEEIKKIPAFLGEPDVLNAIKLLPGVTSVGEGATGFNVRGGNIDQNLILSDNASIYSSSHLFGFFSVFNPDAVKSLEIYKGGMPARFGERVSSVLDVQQKAGDMQKFHADGGIGVVSSRLTLNGPIVKNKSSFLISGRRTYIDQFFRLAKNETVKETKAYFYDLNAKLDYSINTNNYISFTGYHGLDVFDLRNSTFRFDWGNTFGVLNWDHYFKSPLEMNASLSMTNYNYKLGGADFFYWTSNIRTITQKVHFKYSKWEGHKIGFGFQNNNHKFAPAKVEPQGALKNLFKEFELDKEWAMESGVYLQDEYAVAKKITVLGGLRYSIYNSFGPSTEFKYADGKPKEENNVVDTLDFKNNQISSTYMGLEPRLSAVYKIDSVSSFKASYNRNLQFMQLVSNTTSGLPLDVWKAADYHIEPLKVNQFALGYVRGLMKNKIELTIEGYYKSLVDALDYKNNAELFLNQQLETELVQAKGRSFGLEVMLRKKKGKFTGWLSYTLSRAQFKTETPHRSERINNGEWYFASFHKPHDLSFVSSYQWTKRFSTSLNFVYATGRAITYPDGKYEIYGAVIPSYSSRNQGRLSDFHRMDLSAELQSKKNATRKFQSYWNFSVYNLYGRRNAYSYTFENDPNQPPTVNRLAILGTIFPSVTYNFKF